MLARAKDGYDYGLLTSAHMVLRCWTRSDKHAPVTISADDTVSSRFSKVEIEAKSERDSYVL